MSLEAVVDEVRERVTPDEDERERLEQVADDLRERARDAIDDRPVDADVLLVGSTARGTWLAGDRDVDVFVRFPTDLDREELEDYGLQVGHAVLPEGHEAFAEHPYVNGEYDGFAVDLVPCYAVDAATEIRSAVDRTPFHTAYLRSRLDADLASEVRVAKAFLTGIGVYGSDLRTRGFSGYLTELLVLEYGSFAGLVEAAADWRPPVELDPEDHGRGGETAKPSRNDEVGCADLAFDDPLVVVDPTDPERNVAAVVSETNVARLVHHAGALLAEPRVDLFDPDDVEPLSADAVHEHVRERGTHPVAVRFDAPDVVDDQLYPQLDKSLAGLAGELDRRGFDPVRSARFADETAALFVECAVAERPAIERHEGPPVGVREHAEGFYGTYADDPEVYGPFVDGARYVVEREREFRTPEAVVHEGLFAVSLGPHVESALEAGYEVLAGEDVAALAAEFGVELARYFDPRP
jgi:tRNA nucleotidyltransferase (CCA-adding enzyme)